MKKRIKALLMALLLVTGVMANSPLPAYAAGGVGSTIRATFKDEKLAQAVAAQMGKNLDYVLTQGDIDGTKSFTLNDKGISSLDGLENFTSLTRLSLDNNSITNIDNLYALTNLEYLTMGYNQLAQLSPGIGKWTKLRSLLLNSNDIQGGLPEDFGELINLKEINLNRNFNLGKLPESIGNLANLTELNLTNTGITSLPSTIGKLKNLKALYCYGNALESLPDGLTELTQLQSLLLQYNNLADIPQNQYDALAKLGTHSQTGNLQAQEKFSTIPEKGILHQDVLVQAFPIYSQIWKYIDASEIQCFITYPDYTKENPHFALIPLEKMKISDSGIQIDKSYFDMLGEYWFELAVKWYDGPMSPWWLNAPNTTLAGSSYSSPILIEKDTTPPKMPTIHTVTPSALSVSGTADPGVTVTIRDAAETILGEGIADENGNYSIALNRAAIGEEKLFAKAKNASGIESVEEGNTTVLPLQDTLMLTAEVVTPSALTVSGTTAPGAEVSVTDSAGKELGKGLAAEDGSYTIPLNREAIAGETLSVTARKGSGNAVTIEVQVSSLPDKPPVTPPVTPPVIPPVTPPVIPPVTPPVIPPVDNKPARPPMVEWSLATGSSSGYGVDYRKENVQSPSATTPAAIAVKDVELIAYRFTVGSFLYEDIINKQTLRQHEMDVAPIMESQRTLLPLRYVANALHIGLVYDATTRTATFTKGSDVVTLNIDSDTLYKNGVPYKLDAPVRNINRRALVSVANIAYAFDMTSGSVGDATYNEIEWNQVDKSATIYPDLAAVREEKSAMKYHVEEK